MASGSWHPAGREIFSITLKQTLLALPGRGSIGFAQASFRPPPMSSSPGTCPVPGQQRLEELKLNGRAADGTNERLGLDNTPSPTSTSKAQLNLQQQQCSYLPASVATLSGWLRKTGDVWCCRRLASAPRLRELLGNCCFLASKVLALLW